MLSFGTLSARASRMALASLRFMSAFPPPSLAAIWMARQSFDHSLPRRASAAPFLCLMVAQWECPDMRALDRPHRARSIPDSSRESARGRHPRRNSRGAGILARPWEARYSDGDEYFARRPHQHQGTDRASAPDPPVSRAGLQGVQDGGARPVQAQELG